MIDGFINLKKPANMTSHDAVNLVRKKLNTKKVGHGGTLDPAAVGVLPIAIGRATKFLEYLADCDKTYRAEVLFGVSTDSGDLDGEIISRVENFEMPAPDEIESVLKNFIGQIEQTPPKHSAIKINGRKAYDLARKNIDFEVPRRVVKIHEIKILNVAEKILTLEIDCAKGTYIRSLAADIGESLNLPATLKFLTRVRVGDFDLADSCDFNNLKILPVDSCLSNIKIFELPSRRIKAFCNGLPTDVEENDARVKVYSDEKFLGIGKIRAGELRSEKLFIDSLN